MTEHTGFITYLLAYSTTLRQNTHNVGQSFMRVVFGEKAGYVVEYRNLEAIFTSLLVIALVVFLASGVRAEFKDLNESVVPDETLTALTDVQGACERLKTTPVPRQYEYFPRVFMYVYAVILPLSLGAHLEWFTPLVSVPISFLFMALEKVGEVMETPFENRITDVPLSAMCRTIERNLRELAGDTEKLPPVLEPVDGYLW